MRLTVPTTLVAAMAYATTASALTLTVQESACRFVTAHRPAADVEYRPGVDVHGKRVAPADLNGSFALDPLNEIIIDITTDVAGRLTGPFPGPPSGFRGQLPQTPFFANGSVGFIVLEGGQLLFNGRPLQDPFAEELAVLCAMGRRGR